MSADPPTACEELREFGFLGRAEVLWQLHLGRVPTPLQGGVLRGGGGIPEGWLCWAMKGCTETSYEAQTSVILLLLRWAFQRYLF